jgi:hypothetical protein
MISGAGSLIWNVRHMGVLNRTSWRIWIFPLVAIPIGFLDIILFNGCGCWFGAWENYQAAASLSVIGLVGLRFVGAWLSAEQNGGWKYYLIILASSPFLVMAAFAIARLALPPDLRAHP